MSVSFVGITVAGLFRILTGFPINCVSANQNVAQNYDFFLLLPNFMTIIFEMR